MVAKFGRGERAARSQDCAALSASATQVMRSTQWESAKTLWATISVA